MSKRKHNKQREAVPAPVVAAAAPKAAASPFVDPPAKREPLRVSLGSALIGGQAAVLGSATIGGPGAVLG